MEVVPKKGPGRPKKAVGVAAMEVAGIIPPPAGDPGNLAGLTYANPMLFKRMFHLFKQYAVSEVDMCWGANGLEIAVVDHLMKSHIAVTVAGACMNAYYCVEPIRIQMRRGSLDHIATAIGKAHTRITMVVRQSETVGRVSLCIAIRNSDVDSDSQHCVDAMHRVAFEPEVQHDDTDYPIKFHFTSAHFKLVVSNARKLSKTITIEQVGSGPMRLTIPAAEDLGWDEVYDSPAKIGLVSTLADGEIFTVDMTLDYIKPLSSNIIGDMVHIAAHRTEHMSFTTHLDKNAAGNPAATIKIYTET